MSQNRSRPNLEQAMPPRHTVSAVAAAETLRNAYTSPPPPQTEERLSLFWRVFGGTLLSIAALVGITVYQSFAGSLVELRTSISHVNELQANLATKDDLNTRATALWAASKDVTAQAGDLKTRTALLETQVRSAEEERKELNREIFSLRERLRALEARPAEAPKVQGDPTRKVDTE